MKRKSKQGRRQKNMSLLPETIDKIDELSAQYKIARRESSRNCDRKFR